MKKDFETESLNLLTDMQNELVHALNSLIGQPSDLIQRFKGHSAAHISRVAEAYVLLRKAGRNDCSKLFIRPAVEVLFKIYAVENKPELLYQIAFTEHQEERKMAEIIAKQHGKSFKKEFDASWNKMVKDYAAQYPKHKLVDAKLPLIDAARAANMLMLYERAYRIYCGITHAAFSAITRPRRTDSFDNITMIDCVYGALPIVVSIGGKGPNAGPLTKRMRALMETMK